MSDMSVALWTFFTLLFGIALLIVTLVRVFKERKYQKTGREPTSQKMYVYLKASWIIFGLIFFALIFGTPREVELGNEEPVPMVGDPEEEAEPVPLVAEADEPIITTEKLNLFTEGMTYEEVVEILGAEGEKFSESKSLNTVGLVSYKWENEENGWMVAHFKKQDDGTLNLTDYYATDL